MIRNFKHVGRQCHDHVANKLVELNYFVMNICLLYDSSYEVKTTVKKSSRT